MSNARTGRLTLSEAFASTTARPWRLFLFALVGGLLLAAPALLEVVAADQLTSLLSDEERRGTNVLVVESESGEIDALECQAIAAQDGVEFSGAVSAPTTVAVGETRLTTARSVRATSGYFRILGYPLPSRAEPRAVMGYDLAREVSMSDGAPLLVVDSITLLAETASPSVRQESRGRWITIPVPVLEEAQQCWVQARESALRSVRAAIPAYFHEAQSLEVSSLRDMKMSEQALAGWTDRSTRWMFVPCGIFAGLVLGILVWPRRSEYALYRVLGMGRSAALLLAGVESALLFTSALLFSGLVGSAVVPFLRGAELTQHFSTLMLQLSLAGSAAAIVMALGCVLLTSGNVAHILRTRGHG